MRILDFFKFDSLETYCAFIKVSDSGVLYQNIVL